MREEKNTLAAKKARYLALVRATKPLSRTPRQQEEIEQAYFEMDAARDWDRLARLDAFDKWLMTNTRRNQCP